MRWLQGLKPCSVGTEVEGGNTAVPATLNLLNPRKYDESSERKFIDEWNENPDSGES